MIRNPEQVSEMCGVLSMLLFLSANAYYPARLIANNFKPWSRETTHFFKKYLDVHMLLNLLGLFTLTLHGHYAPADERNIILSGAFVLTVWLVFAGILMRYNVFHSMKKQMRLIHTQQTLFFVWLVLIILGHLIDA
ncbi:MAG TPA: hypothetical protein HPP76_08850 [Desulfuromonadales bacterium]|nr:hypothetical protein [Desulfuromonadales bacterium]